MSIASTREYSSQMPNVIIGIDKWMKGNRSTVEGMLQSIFEGGERVRSNQDAFKRACQISAQVYNESGADAGYWEEVFQRGGGARQARADRGAGRLVRERAGG